MLTKLGLLLFIALGAKAHAMDCSDFSGVYQNGDLKMTIQQDRCYTMTLKLDLAHASGIQMNTEAMPFSRVGERPNDREIHTLTTFEFVFVYPDYVTTFKKDSNDRDLISITNYNNNQTSQPTVWRKL